MISLCYIFIRVSGIKEKEIPRWKIKCSDCAELETRSLENRIYVGFGAFYDQIYGLNYFQILDNANWIGKAYCRNNPVSLMIES